MLTCCSHARTLLAFLFIVTLADTRAADPTSFQFDFGSGKTAPGYTAVLPKSRYTHTLYRALGPDIGKAFQDGTHHNPAGAALNAECVVAGLKALKACPLCGHFSDQAARVGKFTANSSPQ